MAARRSEVVEAVIAALRDFGPMTSSELADTLPQYHPESVRKTVRRMTIRSERGEYKGLRRAHVSGWTHVVEAGRLYPRPIFMLGDGDNRPKPKPKSRAAIVSQWYHRRRSQRKANFVFNLGLLSKEVI